MWNSPTVRAELARLSQEAGLDSEVLVRAVKTRWNTVMHVLDRAIEMEDVIPALCDMNQFNKPRGKGLRLRTLVPTEEEWDILKQLHSVLLVSRSLPIPPNTH